VWFDSHCHLHLVEEQADLRGVIDSAQESGVSEMTTIGIDVASSRRARDIAHEHRLWFSAGVHPTSATGWDGAAAAAVERLLEDERAVAVGETGLDYYWGEVDPEVQQRAFEDHIALARSTGKALVIHTRDSVEAAIATLERLGAPPRTIFHCWSGDLEALRRALDLDAYISFAGNVTFKSAADLRDAAARVPLERLLLETDSPYLAPVPHRGRPNRPAHLEATGAMVAEVRGEPVERLAQATSQNARRVFGLEP